VRKKENAGGEGGRYERNYSYSNEADSARNPGG
jgi:hypothetical protein